MGQYLKAKRNASVAVLYGLKKCVYAAEPVQFEGVESEGFTQEQNIGVFLRMTFIAWNPPAHSHKTG